VSPGRSSLSQADLLDGFLVIALAGFKDEVNSL
jgi:hypothetical protein